MKFVISSIIALVFCNSAFCGGSVEWDFHALPLLKLHPDILKLISDSLDVSKVGNGVRLGKDFSEAKGKRVPPFEFPARIKGSNRAYNLLLIIHDDSGLHSDSDSGFWIEIKDKMQP